jgi:hypothetical protein
MTARRTDAERLDDAAGVATDRRWSVRTRTRTGVRAQEQLSARAIWMDWYHGGRRLGSPQRKPASSTSVEGQRDERVGLLPFPR